MRWLSSITCLTDLILSRLREAVEDRRACKATLHLVTTERLNNDTNKEMNITSLDPRDAKILLLLFVLAKMWSAQAPAHSFHP